MFWASTINSMRISRPPPRFSPDGEEFVAKPRRIKLVPDAGDPERFSKVIRLPELSIRRSKIPKAGRGLFLNEKVQRGQVLTRYRQKIISERRAKELKLQVAQLDFLPISGSFFPLTNLLVGQSAHKSQPRKMLLSGFQAFGDGRPRFFGQDPRSCRLRQFLQSTQRGLGRCRLRHCPRCEIRHG